MVDKHDVRAIHLDLRKEACFILIYILTEIKDKTKLTLDLYLFQERSRRKQLLLIMLGESVKTLAQANNRYFSLVKYNIMYLGTKKPHKSSLHSKGLCLAEQ